MSGTLGDTWFPSDSTCAGSALGPAPAVDDPAPAPCGPGLVCSTCPRHPDHPRSHPYDAAKRRTGTRSQFVPTDSDPRRQPLFVRVTQGFLTLPTSGVVQFSSLPFPAIA